MYRNLLLFGLVVALFCGPIVIANAADLEKGLWLYLPLSESTGAPKDEGPHSFKTELSGKAPSVKDAGHGKINKAPVFNGKDNFIKIDMASQKKDIDSGYDAKKGLSICAWVKVIKVATDGNGQTRQPIVMKGAGGMWEFALYVYDDIGAGMSMWTCGGAGVSEPHEAGSLAIGKWKHQCGTFKLKEGVNVYVDGESKPVTSAPDRGNGPCETGTRPVFIAHREDGQWLNAQIAEVWMWDHVVNIDVMKQAMNTIGGLAVNPADKMATTWGQIKERR